MEDKKCGATFCDGYDPDDQINHCSAWHNIHDCRLGTAFINGQVALAAPPQVAHNNQQQKPSRAEELVNAHWGHYVGPLLKSCGVAADLLPMLEFMYKSSGVHFYKHAQEDQREVSHSAMRMNEISLVLKPTE